MSVSENNVHIEIIKEKLVANAQDLVNNNHMTGLEDKAQNLSLNENNFLFDPVIFSMVKASEFKFQYDKFELIKSESGSLEQSLIDLGDNLVLRPLKRDDFKRNYIGLMSHLSEVGEVSQQDFEKRFDQMKQAANTYFVCVVEDVQNQKVVASLTLVYEQKFIRQVGSRGRFEDMVVDVNYRGKRLSKLLLDVVVQISQILGCYKISLECKDHLKKHYEQFGFSLEQGQNYLCRRFI
ncbi:glucosamine 6-phosphate N-acetyltransferase [Brachionus plicatilis]|uniref:Glucosamine 6-phosphate N-acetyltransferase n=1 Tax=Brachionus plicatilis TaxID=10195 RepID=A0A3M7Q1A2_BRAPC|nr:glucosamine 6-phosphate N-acetyltransferase [Brachionus plicatilis]